MDAIFKNNWTTDNNGYPLNDAQVLKLVSVVPNERQYNYLQEPFNVFIHFGMNTATGREWGSGTETVDKFTIKKINAKQWVSTIKKSGATGIILTCKHHDGFCLWPSAYTDFCIKNTDFEGDIVKMVSDECHKQGVKFGVYLSPWDMHESTYATEAYNDYFCNQLTELLTNYGEIFEVWFDGAKGAKAKAFDYDWKRYYDLIYKLQPNANIAVCGPDVRWVGNEAGKSRPSEFSVVPQALNDTYYIQKNSQSAEKDTTALKEIKSVDMDLGSRKILRGVDDLCWYPAEVDVSIRKGWFWSAKSNITVKSVRKLMKIYYNSIGNNCTLLLNVPPTKKGVIHKIDALRLEKFGKAIKNITAKPIIVENFGELKDTDDYLEFNFDSPKKLRHCIICEDIKKSQRIEAFDLYIKKPNGKYKKVYAGTTIGTKKIIPLKVNAVGAVLVIRQSRSTPYLTQVGFYE